MSRTGLIAGLIISAVLHLWLFRYLPSNALAKTVNPAKHNIATVDVVRIEESQQQVAQQQEVNEPSVVSRQPEQEYNQQPVEPIQTVELEESNKKLLSQSDKQGDFAGSTNGIERPILRINWGSAAQATVTLRACALKLVILEPDGSIGHELVPGSAGSWQATRLIVEAGLRYSDSIRLVGNVPAFASARAYTKSGSGQSLAVLMPVNIEKMIEAAKLTYAYQQGLRMRDIATFGGYFSTNTGNVDFVIEKIQLRR